MILTHIINVNTKNVQNFFLFWNFYELFHIFLMKSFSCRLPCATEFSLNCLIFITFVLFYFHYFQFCFFDIIKVLLNCNCFSFETFSVLIVTYGVKRGKTMFRPQRVPDAMEPTRNHKNSCQVPRNSWQFQEISPLGGGRK